MAWRKRMLGILAAVFPMTTNLISAEAAEAQNENDKREAVKIVQTA